MLCKYVLNFKYETYYIKYNLYSLIITFNHALLIIKLLCGSLF